MCPYSKFFTAYIEPHNSFVDPMVIELCLVLMSPLHPYARVGGSSVTFYTRHRDQLLGE